MTLLKLFLPLATIAFLFSVLFPISASAQELEYEWTKTFSGTDIEYPQDAVSDSNDNIYIIGSFRSTVDFDPTEGTDNHTSAGLGDIFLIKINADGSYGYTYTFGSTDNDIGHGVAIDSSDNIYLTGFFGGTVDFDPTAGTDEHTSAGGQDIFLTKINADGSYGYTYTFGGTSNDVGYSVAIDSQEDIYLTGDFQGTVDFDPTGGTDEHTSAGGQDIFLTKIDANASYGYTHTFGGASSDIGQGVSTDSQDNVYLTGSFNGTVDFDPTAGTDNHTSAGLRDIFLIKINADGSYGYTYTFGSTDNDIGHGVAIDSLDNIYITGKFFDTVDFDPTGSTDEHTSAGGADVFLTKINSDGSYNYTYTFGSTGRDIGDALAVDSQDNIYMGGQFGLTVDFDPTGGTDEHTAGGWDDAAFLTKINADASYGSTHTVFGVDVDDSGSYVWGVAVSSKGAYFTGDFFRTVDFNPDGGGDQRVGDEGYNGDIYLTFLSFASTVVSSSPAPTSVSSQTGTLSVQPSQEGETTYFSHTGTRAKLQVPRGALTLPTQIEIIPHESSSATDFLPDKTTLVPNTLYEYKTSPGLGVSVGDPKILDTFTTPVTVSIQVPDEPVDPSSMQIHYFQEDSQEWIPLETTYHASSKTFSADTSHFTLFALLEVAEEEPEPVAVSELQEQSAHLLSLIESLISSVEQGLEEETITPQQASQILSPLDTGLQSLNDLLEQERQSSLQASIHEFANSSALWITLLVLILIALVTRKRWQGIFNTR